METTAKEFLKGKHQRDFILNPEDLPEYHVRLSQLLEEYKSFKGVSKLPSSKDKGCACYGNNSVHKCYCRMSNK